MVDLFFRVVSEKAALTGWRYFWAKKVTAVSPRVHCARCLVGSYESVTGTRMAVNRDIPLHGYEAGDIFYVCGVAAPYKWANNLHLAVRVTGKDTDVARVTAYTGDRISLVWAVVIPFDDTVAIRDYGHLAKSYLTCRNFQFGVQMVDDGVLPILDGAKSLRDGMEAHVSD